MKSTQIFAGLQWALFVMVLCYATTINANDESRLNQETIGSGSSLPPMKSKLAIDTTVQVAKRSAPTWAEIEEFDLEKAKAFCERLALNSDQHQSNITWKQLSSEPNPGPSGQVDKRLLEVIKQWCSQTESPISKRNYWYQDYDYNSGETGDQLMKKFDFLFGHEGIRFRKRNPAAASDFASQPANEQSDYNHQSERYQPVRLLQSPMDAVGWYTNKPVDSKRMKKNPFKNEGIRFKRHSLVYREPGEGRFKKSPFLNEGIRYKKSPFDEEGIRFKKSPFDEEGIRYKKSPFEEEGIRFKKSPFDEEGIRFKKTPFDSEGIRF